MCEVTGGTLTPSDETSEIKYFDVRQLPALITDHAQRIKDALEEKPQAVIA